MTGHRCEVPFGRGSGVAPGAYGVHRHDSIVPQPQHFCSERRSTASNAQGCTTMPRSRNGRAAASSVAPVVRTSSTSRTVMAPAVSSRARAREQTAATATAMVMPFAWTWKMPSSAASRSPRERPRCAGACARTSSGSAGMSSTVPNRVATSRGRCAPRRGPRRGSCGTHVTKSMATIPANAPRATAASTRSPAIARAAPRFAVRTMRAGGPASGNAAPRITGA